MSAESKVYRMRVEPGEDGWWVAEGIDDDSLLTQGADLDELAAMVFAAIVDMHGPHEFSVELVFPNARRLERAA